LEKEREGEEVIKGGEGERDREEMKDESKRKKKEGGERGREIK
jgi:hypothetical protein